MTTRNFITTLLCCLCCIPIQGYAQEDIGAYTVNDVPDVQAEDKDAYTTDPQNILGAEWVQKINSLAATIHTENSAELAVVVLPKISDDYANAYEFAYELFKFWGLGTNSGSNGLLVLLITNKDKQEICFEVGYALEDTLPDGLCRLIQNRVMIPMLKKGDYGAGLVAGVEEIQRVLNDHSDLKAEYDKEQNSDIFSLKNIGIAIGVIIVIILNVKIWKIRKKDFKIIAECGGESTYKRYALAKEGEIKPTFREVATYIAILPVLLLILPGIIYWIISGFLFKRRLKKEIICVKCKAAGTNSITGSETEVDRGYFFTTYFFKCRKCGHQHQVLQKTKIRKRRRSKADYSDDSYDYDYSYDYDSDSGGDWGGGSSGGGGSSSDF